MIKERYCSRELCELLRDKGFKGRCHSYYYPHLNTQIFGYPQDWNAFHGYINCPTHQMACDYLSEKYDLHIIVYPYKANNEKKWCCKVFKKYNMLGYERYFNESLNSLEEAVEEALKYCLTELI